MSNVAATLRTHIGKVRKQNEDAVFMDERRGIYAVADGMGGHLAGEVASGLAVEAVRELAESDAPPRMKALQEAVSSAHERIAAHAKSHPECSGMGTTLSMIWTNERYAFVAHVGDSRVYRLRGGRLEQITRDHSLVEELVAARLITRQQARVHPRRNIITRALGTDGDHTPDLQVTESLEGDVWLLCTDGLTGMVDDMQIARALALRNVEKAADRLLESALDAGGRDNISLVVYREEGQAWNQD